MFILEIYFPYVQFIQPNVLNKIISLQGKNTSTEVDASAQTNVFLHTIPNAVRYAHIKNKSKPLGIINKQSLDKVNASHQVFN